MKAPLAIVGSLTLALNAAGHTRETAIVAMMKLSEEPNYSWNSSVIDDAQTYEIAGKTVRAGYTWQRQPMSRTVARRLARSAGHEFESFFRGKFNYVIGTEDGWRRLDELPKLHPDWYVNEWIYVSVPAGSSRPPTPGLPADPSQIDPLGQPAGVYVPILREWQEDDDAPYSNAQFALALPHEELSVIVSCHARFDLDGDVALGTLTSTGAELLLVHDGHEYIQTVNAAGRFKIWFRGDRVEKYVVELAGLAVVGRKTVQIRQRSTTTLTAFGTTAFYIPGDALRRLGGEALTAASR